MIETSTECGELFGALAKAQGAMRSAAKDAKNNHTNKTYATLASAVDAVREPLSANGLALMQWPVEGPNGGVSVVTYLGHASGQWMRSTQTSPVDKQNNKVQAIGSTITYLRRYALMAVCGIAPDDDDGEGAKGAKTRPTPKRKPAPKKSANPDHHASWTEKVRVDFCSNLPKTFGGLTYKDLAAFLQAHGDPRPSAMSQEDRVALWRDLQGGKSADVVEWCAIQAAAKGAA